MLLNSWHDGYSIIQRLLQTCRGGQHAGPTDIADKELFRVQTLPSGLLGQGLAFHDRFRSAWSAAISLSGKFACRGVGILIGLPTVLTWRS
jgi:hypothetical protein